MTAAPIQQDPKPDPPDSQSQKWGRVVLSISNSVMPLDKLSPTPSSGDGMTPEMEVDLRNIGCNLIQTAGKLLRLPQVAMATACVMYQRFFYCKSYVRYSFEHVAMGCVCLASKIEESPRRPRDVINVFTHIKQVRQGKPIKPVILDPEYIRLKNDIIKAERRVLKELGFCVHIKHPHKLIVMYLQLLSYENNVKFTQMAWNFMNDSLRTDCFVRYQPETIACACIYLSARKLNIPLPRKPSWYELLGVEEDDIRDCCYRIICLYTREKVNQDEMEKGVEKLKFIQDQKKKEAKLNLALGSTAVNSPASQPTSPHRQKKSDRSRSKSLDKKKKKKHTRKDRSSSSERDIKRKDLKRKGGERGRDWSHSPIHKSRKHRSRSRERLSDRGRYDRKSEKYDKSDHKAYSEKGKRDYYRR